jgi:hypothetical protein
MFVARNNSESICRIELVLCADDVVPLGRHQNSNGEGG